jgi:hypothetical protein
MSIPLLLITIIIVGLIPWEKWDKTPKTESIYDKWIKIIHKKIRSLFTT